MSKIKKISDGDTGDKHVIKTGQHIDNPYQSLAELEAAKEEIDSRLYEIAKADLTREGRVQDLLKNFPWDDDMDNLEDKDPVLSPVKDIRTEPVCQPGYLFADKILFTSEQIVDYVIGHLKAYHLNNNAFSVCLGQGDYPIQSDLFKARFDEKWTLETRIRVFDLLEAACLMTCQLGERGRRLDNKIDEIIPPLGPGKAYGIVSVFLDDDAEEGIFIRINVQKGMR